METVKLAVGIVFYRNSPEQIASIIGSARRALQLSQTGPCTILACDNGGESPSIVLPPDVRAIVSDENKGFGAGHNVLMEIAFAEGAEAYIGANPDGAFHPDSIRHLVGLHDSHCGGALIEAQQFPNESLKNYDPHTLHTSWASGACFLISKQIFQSTGGFDDNIFLYCEDVDLSWSAARQGFAILHCPQALFHHDMSERENEEQWRYDLMHVSGRYLGHKWGCDWFRDWCEAELLAAGRADRVIDLRSIPRLTDTDHSKDFEHRFAFSVVR